MTDIFISYASEDRAVAARLAAQLQSHGWQVWWDRDLRSGVDYTREIAARLEAARCVLVLWSVSSVGSHWVRDEANEGLRRQALVPVRIDDASPPYGFRSLQTLSLQPWLRGGDTSELSRLVSDIGHLLNAGGGADAGAGAGASAGAGGTAGAAATPPPARRTTGPVHVAHGRARRWWLALAGLAVTGAALVMVYFRVVVPEDPSVAARMRAIEAARPPPADTLRDATQEGTADGAATAREPAVNTLGPYATRRRAEEVASDLLRQRGGGRARVVHEGAGYYVHVVPAP